MHTHIVMVKNTGFTHKQNSSFMIIIGEVEIFFSHAGHRANDQLHGYRSNYKKVAIFYLSACCRYSYHTGFLYCCLFNMQMWHIFGNLLYAVAILSNILLEIGRLEDELNYVWICLIPYTYVLLLILGIIKQSKIIISYGMLHIMVRIAMRLCYFHFYVKKTAVVIFLLVTHANRM